MNFQLIKPYLAFTSIVTTATITMATLAYIPNSGAEQKNNLPEVEQRYRTPVNNLRLLNNEATVPPMCYTQTEQKHNPCYVCHQAYPAKAHEYRYNKLSDFGLQGEYLFSEVGLNNHWTNLFVDRSQWINQISDKAIITYVNQENYSGLAMQLRSSGFNGYIPDLANFNQGSAAFDSTGLAKDGSGWVAFNYKPLPSTFWPTNGATDDVLIRLPEKFRRLNNTFNRDIYYLNLSLVETNIKQLSYIDIFPINEIALQIDVNNDGQLSQRVTKLKRSDKYLGDASDVALKPQQFPKGTEFLHSVRYLGVSQTGEITTPPRMKELRYMKKYKELSEADIDNRYRRERKEKIEEELPYFINLGDRGMDNGFGWQLQGFIEDYKGQLRPQSFEETLFCMGCHSAVGTTIDHTFSFARKITGAKGWGYINLKGMRDAPSIAEPGGEILNYLKRVGGGNEFRQNNEIYERWFNNDGSLNINAIENADVYQLITPSVERALQLNKAYTHIVRHQSFIFGRDPTVKPSHNVFKTIDESTTPLPYQHRVMAWDIRLDWSAAQSTGNTNGARMP